MKLTLSRQQAHALAAEFASTVMARVVHVRLARIGHQRFSDSAFGEVCAAVRSIRCVEERKEFSRVVGWHFKRLRAEAGRPARWQDYVASVERARKEEAA